MKMRVYLAVLLALWLQNTQALNASVIDDSGPNPMVVGKAFGFMLFGNDGFMKPGIENLAVDGCIVSYEGRWRLLLTRNSKTLHQLRPK
jgi:hypothetical protein